MGHQIQLWGAGTARTLRPIWVAEELGIPYEVEPIGPRTGEIDESGLYVIRRHDDLGYIYGEAPRVVASAGRYVMRHLDVVAAHLSQRRFVLEQGFGLADIVLVSCLNWAIHCGLELPAVLQRYREEHTQRPAYYRAVAANRQRNPPGELPA